MLRTPSRLHSPVGRLTSSPVELSIEPGRQHDLPSPALAAAPAQARDEIGDRGQRVGPVVPDVLAAVAVVIDRISEKGRGHELALPHRACPGPGHIVGPDMSLIENAQCRDQLAAEIRAAASVIGERGQRRDHRVIAHDFAEIALDTPQGDDKARLDIEPPPDPVEQHSIFGQLVRGAPSMRCDVTTLSRYSPKVSVRSGCLRSSSMTCGRNCALRSATSIVDARTPCAAASRRTARQERHRNRPRRLPPAAGRCPTRQEMEPQRSADGSLAETSSKNSLLLATICWSLATSEPSPATIGGLATADSALPAPHSRRPRSQIRRRIAGDVSGDPPMLVPDAVKAYPASTLFKGGWHGTDTGPRRHSLSAAFGHRTRIWAAF